MSNLNTQVEAGEIMSRSNQAASQEKRRALYSWNGCP